jgi:hypothetical protein
MAKSSANSEKLWPFQDDRVLGEFRNWSSAVAFDDYSADRHFLMMRGYFRAGHVLVDKCCENPNEKYAMIYPILFCYRHALEMTMQWIISTYGDRYGVSLPTKKDHQLDPLWKCCKAIFTHPDIKSSAAVVSRVERVMKQFHRLDTRAEAFRYSVKKDGTLIRLPNIPFDLVNLREVMRRLENFFRAVDRDLNLLFSSINETQSN